MLVYSLIRRVVAVSLLLFLGNALADETEDLKRFDRELAASNASREEFSSTTARLEEYVALHPDSKQAAVMLASAYEFAMLEHAKPGSAEFQTNLQKAAHLNKKLFERYPDDAVILRQYARFVTDSTERLLILQRAAEVAPDDFGIQFELGTTYSRVLNKPEASLPHLKRAYERENRSWVKVHYASEYIYSLRQSGKRAEADSVDAAMRKSLGAAWRDGMRLE